MLLPRRVAGRTLGLHGPDLARGPEVARLWPRVIKTEDTRTHVFFAARSRHLSDT